MNDLSGTDRDGKAVDAFTGLHDRCAAMIAADGQSATALPGLWLVRIATHGTYPRNFSPLLHIAVALSGRKIVEVAGQRAVNDREHYLVVLGSQRYDAWVETSGEPYLALKLQFPPDLVARTLLDLADAGHRSPHPTGKAPPLFVGPLDGHLVDLLGRLLDTLDDPVDRRTLAPAYVAEIAYRLLRSDAAAAIHGSIRQSHRKILNAMRFIEENACQPLHVAAIAERVGVSPAHFARQFREMTSVTPMQYLKMARLNSARRLLLHEHQRLDHVCERVGYLSVSHFSRDFRNHFGISPSRYADTFWQGETQHAGTGKEQK